MKNYTITVNGNVYNVTVEEGTTAGAAAPAPKAAVPAAAPKAAPAPAPAPVVTPASIEPAVAAPTAPNTPPAQTNPSDENLAPGANSFTEAQAKSWLEEAGYTEVTGLVQSDDGIWRGHARRNGATVAVDGEILPAQAGGFVTLNRDWQDGDELLLTLPMATRIESRYFVEQGIDAKWGIIQATGWTSIQNMPGIFAGGDCATGPATVIRAIAAGKVAAANIDQYLGYNHEITCDVKIPEPDLSDRTPCGRVNLTERPAGERKCDFTLTECGMSLKEAGQEARRCLRCDHFGYGNFKGGRTTSW